MLSALIAGGVMGFAVVGLRISTREHEPLLPSMREGQAGSVVSASRRSAGDAGPEDGRRARWAHAGDAWPPRSGEGAYGSQVSAKSEVVATRQPGVRLCTQPSASKAGRGRRAGRGSRGGVARRASHTVARHEKCLSCLMRGHIWIQTEPKPEPNESGGTPDAPA